MRGTLAEYSLLLSFTRYLQYAQVSSRAFNDSILSFHVRRIGRKRVAKYFPCITRDRETIFSVSVTARRVFSPTNAVSLHREI